MRVAMGLCLLLAPLSSSFAQAPCPPSPQRLAFDPYKPGDLAIVRNYGGAVLSQAPLSTLLALDPYVPVEAELLRLVGRAIPWWPYPGCPQCPPQAPLAPQPSPCPPETMLALPDVERPGPVTQFSEVVSILESRGALQAATSRSETAGQLPARAQGISIVYNGREWTSGGPAVPFSETAFEQAGLSGQTPVYRLRSGDRSVIYIPTTPGMVAPFRPSR